jgi:cysteine desulfurase
MKRVYLDNAATTPVAKEVFGAMAPYFTDKFGNASSIHSFGQDARAAIDESRRTVANFLNCTPSEIIFTSGGSESDNLAVKGIIDSFINQKSKIKNKNYGIINNSNKLTAPLAGETANSSKLKANFIPHIIASQFEHHAVLDVVRELERDGKIEATYIKPNNEGLIDPKDIERAIKANTVLVSIMYVNNEIGTVQPIREIGKLIERINAQRIKDYGLGIKGKEKIPSAYSIPHATFSRLFFHTDAVQATEYMPMDTKYLHVDLLTLSAHKIYGPKGVGALFIKKGTPLTHQIIGGGQEYKLRAGTENVASIIGFAEAVMLINNLKLKTKNYNLKVNKLRDRLIDGLLKIPGSRLNGSKTKRTPNNVNVSFDNAEGESILINLDMAGVAASSGSACTSGSLEPSHVLSAIGVPRERSHGSIRFTLGRSTTKEEIDYVIKIMPKIIEKLRAMSPFK